jgi:hypothetical protein
MPEQVKRMPPTPQLYSEKIKTKDVTPCKPGAPTPLQVFRALCLRN